MTEKEAKAKTQADRDERIALYRDAAKELFQQSVIDLRLGDDLDNCDRLIVHFEQLIKELKDNKLNPTVFDEEDYENIATALQLDIAITYDEFVIDPSNGQVRRTAHDDSCLETQKVEKLQELIRNFCLDAAKFAETVHSETKAAWTNAYTIVNKNCLNWVHDACHPDDAHLVAATLFKNLPLLNTDITIHVSRLQTKVETAIRTVVSALSRTLTAIRRTEDPDEIATLLSYDIGHAFEPMSVFVNAAIDLNEFEQADTYDASEIGSLLSEIAEIRFRGDDQLIDEIKDDIDQLMDDVDNYCSLYRGYLIEGVPDKYHTICNWFLRKDNRKELDPERILNELVLIRKMLQEERLETSKLTEINTELKAEISQNHKEIDKLLMAVLYVTSGKTHGRPLEGLDFKGMVRKAMTRYGADLCENNHAPNPSKAAEMTQKAYYGLPDIYGENETEALRKAIERECEKRELKNAPKSPKTNPH